ncbi:MAG: glycoside hydrolase family 2 TIM barrel-domain containing protein [Verrucomicrobiota bacterium]
MSLCLLTLASVAAPQTQAVLNPNAAVSMSPTAYRPIDERAEFSLLLSGVWKFKLGPVDAAFYKPAFDDQSWLPIKVPGNWEIQGFEQPAYGKKPADTEGFYRHRFTTPAAWTNRRVFMRFEGVGFGFEFWIDGKPVGSFASSFNRSEFDVTDFVTPGRSAVIAVRVSRRAKGWEFDTNDDWALSGIHRDVVLFSLPDVHVQDYVVTTPVRADLKQATVRVKARVESFSGKTVAAPFKVQLQDDSGAVVGSFVKNLTVSGRAAAEVDGEVIVSNPRLWNSESPTLYRLNLDLSVAGQSVHEITQRVGLRATTIENGVFKLNGQSVKFRGVNHHDLHPETGRAMTRDQYRQDLELMKAANITAIRMSHYPPQTAFLDLCDEYGIYVIDEVPFGFGEQHLTDESYADILALRATATVNRDKNRTSVLVWTVGNENPYTPMVLRTAGLVKQLDPSRPRCLAHPTDKYFFPLPPELDILAPHYLVARSKPGEVSEHPFLDDILKRPDCGAPVLMTEYAHAAGTSLEDLKRCWELMQSNDRFMGGCIWMFQDQGIYRQIPDGLYPGLPKTTDAVPVVINRVKASTWVSKDCVIDTSGQDGADGIVDADRVPQSDFWAVRKIYSPVVIPIISLSAKAGRQTLSIPVQNRYDFTDLSAVLGRWELYVDGQKVREDGLTLRAPPRQSTTCELTVNLPEQPELHDLFLRFSFWDARHRPISEHTVRLLPEARSVATYSPWLKAASTNRIVEQARGADVIFEAGNSRLGVNSKTGAVRFGVAGQPELGFEGLALRVGRVPQMSEVRAYREMANATFWTPYLLTNATLVGFNRQALTDGRMQIDLSLRFNRPDAESDQECILADVRLTLAPQGWLDVDYTLSPKNASGYLLEIGLALKLAVVENRLTWLGEGPYAVYPAQADGMERGVYSVVPKPDAIDPTNRIYPGNRADVDLATVTDSQGAGLGVVCQSATVSVEPDGDAVFFSHLAKVAGHGQKRAVSSVHINAAKLEPVSGNLRLVPLVARHWPALFQSVLSNPTDGGAVAFFGKPAAEGVSKQTPAPKTKVRSLVSAEQIAP